MASDVVIPKRARFKPSEVCSIAGVQPYILRSWETEFPALGSAAATKNGARVYQRSDVELVLQIKELVFGEGLTLGAARRKLDAERPELMAVPEPAPTEAETTTVEAAPSPEPGLFDSDARARLEDVKRGLREIVAMLAPEGEAVTSPTSGDDAPAADADTESSKASGAPSRRRSGTETKARGSRRTASKQTTA